MSSEEVTNGGGDFPAAEMAPPMMMAEGAGHIYRGNRIRLPWWLVNTLFVDRPEPYDTVRIGLKIGSL